MILHNIIVLAVVTLASCSAAQKTITLCETNGPGQLSCSPGKHIQITSVVYGRTHILPSSTCNKYHATGMNFNCVGNANAATYVNKQCTGKTKCFVANTYINLGDPCPGTPKFLKIDYECIVLTTVQTSSTTMAENSIAATIEGRTKSAIPRFVTKPSSSSTSEVTICEQRSATITCPAGKQLLTTHVLWGRMPPAPASLCNPYKINVTGVNCQSETTPRKYVESLCNGKQTCTVTNDWSKLGPDPCNSIPKYLQVSFQCEIPSTTSRTTAEVTICEQRSATFTCPAGKQLLTTHVLWGRMPPAPASLCNPYKSPVTGVNCQSETTPRKYVESICNGKQTCTVTNDWTKLGPDPCTGSPKYLQVSFQCEIPSTTSWTTAEVTICEQRSATFTCPAGKQLLTTHVLWGRMPPAPASLCNPYKSPVTGVNCQSETTPRKYVESICNGKQTCTVTNDWKKLGPDPCYSSPKYLQVSFQCEIPSTTSRTTALECFSCPSPVMDPKDCTTTKTCEPNSQCMMKHLRAMDGHHEYSMACEWEEVCNGLRNGFLFGKRDIYQRNVSMRCCDTDLCNMPTMTTTNGGGYLMQRESRAESSYRSFLAEQNRT